MAIRYLSGIDVDSNTLFVDDANNRVGIGTASPSYKASIVAANGNYWNGTAFTGTPLALSIENSEPGGYDPVLIYNQADSGGTLKNSGAIGMIGTGPWTAGNNALQVSDMYFLIRNSSGGISERLRIKSTGAAQLKAYGSGSFTGTVAYNLAVDSSGNIIETAGGVVDGSGTANYVSKWSDANTLTDSVIYDNGTNVGIGTTGPQAKLDISGGYIRLQEMSNNANGWSVHNNSGYLSSRITTSGHSRGWGWEFTDNYPDSATPGVYFRVGYDGTVSYLTSGNFGIGTNNPTVHSGGNALVVAGKSGVGSGRAIIELAETGGGRAVFQQVGSSTYIGNLAGNGPLILLVGGSGSSATEAVYINNSGNVGIGTTAPKSKLQIIGPTLTTNNENSYAVWVSDTGDDTKGLLLGYDLVNDVGVIQAVDQATSWKNISIASNGGNVSIGTTTNSGARTNIFLSEAGATPNAILRLQNTGSQYLAKMILTDGTTNDAVIGYQGGVTSATQYLGFGIGTSITQMILNASGNVGIGTTAPTMYGGRGMEVSGAGQTGIRISDTAGGGKVEIGSDSSGGYIQTAAAGNALTFYTGNASTLVMRMTDTGNVGIGTTAPSAKLHISGSSTQLLVQGNNYSGIHQAYAWVTNTYFGARYDGTNEVYGATGRGAFKIVALHDADNDPQYLAFYGANAGTAGSTITWNTVGFAQDEDGNVGIGTTSPASLVHIDRSSSSNNITGTPSIIISNRNSTSGTFVSGGIFNNPYRDVSTSSVTAGVWFENQNSPDAGSAAKSSAVVFGANSYSANWNLPTERMRITQGGFVGIGTSSPSSPFTVANDVRAASLTATDLRPQSQLNLLGGGGDSLFIGQLTNSTVYMQSSYFNATLATYPIALNPLGGNVGIGTTAPGQKLQVDGNIYVNDDGTTGNGIMLRGADRPLIARGWDPFTSGNKTGVGRWGVYMESAELFIGAPGTDYSNALITLGGWLLNGTRQPNLTLNNSTQRVGIGTTAPTNKLTVYQGGGVRVTGITSGDWIEMSGDLPGYSANQYPVIKSNGTIHFANNNKYSAFLEGANTYFGILDNTATTRVFLATSGNTYFTGGNVGIGTTAPTANLTIGANTVVQSTNGIALGIGQASLEFVHATFNNGFGSKFYSVDSGGGVTSLRLAVRADSTTWVDAMTVIAGTTGGGNVGIGITEPAKKLHVSGGSGNVDNLVLESGYVSAGVGVAMQFNRSSGVLARIRGIEEGSWNGGLLFEVRSGSTYPGYDGATDVAMKIATNGNVGIGTTAPGAKLEVVAGNTTSISVRSGNSGQYSILSVGRTSSDIIMASAASSGQFWTGSVAGDGWVGSTNGTLSLGNDTTGVANLTIKSGNVGIGTTSPTLGLHVADAKGFIVGPTTYSGSTYISPQDENTINGGYGINADDADIWLNYRGYQDGWSYFRDTRIGNGKGTAITYWNGDTGNMIIGSTTDAGYKLDVHGEILGRDDIRILNTYALVLNGTDNNWRIGRNTISDSGWLTSNTMQMVVFGSSSGQGFQVVNHNGTALFEIDGVAGASRFTNALGVGVNPSGTAGRIDASNDIVAYSTSDQRLKENITPIANALDKVKALTGVEFDWKEETKDVHGYEGHDVGVIAQEVQAVLPEAVRTNDSGYLSVRYEKMIALLVEANKELASRVEELEKKLK